MVMTYRICDVVFVNDPRPRAVQAGYEKAAKRESKLSRRFGIG